MARLTLFVLSAVLVAAAEPAPRRLTAVPIKVAAPFPHITAVHELASGKLLVSDVRTPALVLLDSASGITVPVGSPGASAGQYTQPGGFYAGKAGSILLADHSGPRALTISAAGQITGGYSTARKGVRSSSDSDSDETRLDSRGYAYFLERNMRIVNGNETSGVAELIRLDPAKQTEEVVAKLMIPKTRRISSEGGLEITRGTVGDPGDGWAVLPDGRIAIVHGAPYRVEWVTADGRSTSGPVIAHEPVPFTKEDRDLFNQSAPSAGVGAAGSGSRANTADMDRKFAEFKPPFSPQDVTASPSGRIWVKRSRPFGAATVIYDVFDGAGNRVDRVDFPKDSRVVGFGAGSVYVREGSDKNVQLRKYKVS